MKAKARVALLAGLVGCLIGVVAPTPAVAFQSYFNCISKPSNQWCDGRANGSYDGLNSWDYVEGWYSGTALMVNVCQRVYKPSTGGTLVGSTCRLDNVWHDYGNVQCVCYDAEVLQISSGPKSISGFADSSW